MDRQRDHPPNTSPGGYRQWPTCASKLGHSQWFEFRSRPLQRRQRTGVGILDCQRDWQQCLLGEHGHHHHVGRLGRLVRSRRTQGHQRRPQLGVGICLRFSRAPHRGVTLRQSRLHFPCHSRLRQHPEVHRNYFHVYPRSATPTLQRTTFPIVSTSPSRLSPSNKFPPSCLPPTSSMTSGHPPRRMMTRHLCLRASMPRQQL